MQTCSKCALVKPFAEFHKNKSLPSGHKKECKDCRLIERAKSYAKRKEQDYQGILNYNSEWTKTNPEKAAASAKKWVQANRPTTRLYCNSYYAKAKQARPDWADKEAIKRAYKYAQYFKLEVDHIIPLNHPLVCGLHVDNNMQLLTRKENASKGNSWQS